jgi:hypothetical protein
LHKGIKIITMTITPTTPRHEVIKQLVEKKSFKEKTTKNLANRMP